MNDDFATTINDSGALKIEKDMPSQYPSANSIAEKEKLSVHYGSYVIGKAGSPELEAIMDDCVSGKRLLAQEKWSTNKEGVTSVTIKYFDREVGFTKTTGDSAIQGRRRLKKAQSGG